MDATLHSLKDLVAANDSLTHHDYLMGLITATGEYLTVDNVAAGLKELRYTSGYIKPIITIEKSVIVKVYM